MTIAKTIAAQIGHGALFMIGAKQLTDTGEGLCFKVGRNAKSVSHVTITLAADDTYTVMFTRVRAGKLTILSRLEGIYCDQLRSIIADGTGMAVSL